MNNSLPYTDLSNDQLREVHTGCETFDRALRHGGPVSIEDQLANVGADIRNAMFRELLAIELEWRHRRDETPDIAEYQDRFPDHADDIGLAFEEAARLDDPVRGLAAAADDPHAAAIGSLIGPYKLRELIGEGGMGLVYVAEQETPVRRKVALKIIKPGMDTKEVIARFESERQALAMMDHPHIAHVLDAGVTDSGRPYFVMELIRGVPVTEYCNKRKLSTRARLELFVQICQAVQHAHLKGIIHRDIKPTNILITLRGDVAVPKVIDFGVAKAINQRLTERTVYTQMSQLIGTPMYMSPEQAQRSAEEVDTRTDIFSLGVVLYELLTGTTPLTKERLSQVGYDEMRRIIREEDPPRPSYRLSTLDAAAGSTISDQRSAGPLKLIQILRGELDWIVLKAMEKDYTRRYETARDFAADIQHYLADEPVLACPPSARYRLRKFARRNKVALGLATIAIVGLLAGIIGLAVSNRLITQQKNAAELAKNEETTQRIIAQRQRIEAQRQRIEAQRQRAEAEKQHQRADENFHRARQAVDEFFTLVSEDRRLEPALRKDLIGKAVEFYESFLEHQGDAPNVSIGAANTRLRLAASYVYLGRIEEAMPELEKAFDLVDELLLLVPVDSGEFQNLHGFWNYAPDGATSNWTHDRQRERAVFQRGASLWRRFVDAHPHVAPFRRELAFFLSGEYAGLANAEDAGLAQTQSDGIGSFRILPEVRRLRTELVEQYPDDRTLLAELATTIWHIGWKTEDTTMIRDAISKLVESDLSAYRDDLAAYRHELGWRLMSRGQPAEAAEELGKSVALFRELAREFPDVRRFEFLALCYTSDHAKALANSGQEVAAEQLASELSPQTASDFVLRGNIYKELQMVDKATADYDAALGVGLQGLMPNVGRVGNFLDQQGQHEKAIVFYDYGMETMSSPAVSRICADRGASWAHLKQYQKSLADFTSAIEINAWDCEHHLSRMGPPMLQESPADFQAEFLKLADRAIEITGGNGQSYITRSLVHFNLGQREQAKQDLTRGVELDPNFKVRDYLQPLLNQP